MKSSVFAFILLQQALLKLALVLDRAQQLCNDLRMAVTGGEMKSSLASVSPATVNRLQQVVLQLALVLDRAQQRFNNLRTAPLGGMMKSSPAPVSLLQHVLLTLAVVLNRAQQLVNDPSYERLAIVIPLQH